jgi:hypothetical protein
MSFGTEITPRATSVSTAALRLAQNSYRRKMTYGPDDNDYGEEDYEEGYNEFDDYGMDSYDPDDPNYLIDGVGFADPGGNSALRAATASNPRNLPCPNCGRSNMLTPLDRERGYQCDICADELEQGW